MKRFPQYFLTFVITFVVGTFAVSILFPEQPVLERSETEITLQANTPIAEATIKAVEDQNEEESTNPLEKIWLQDESVYYSNYKFTQKCLQDNEVETPCTLVVTKNKKVLASFDSYSARWLQYGFFNFLGEDDKQLIVQTYSGGAHCCYDYVIYDLEPAFRIIYDSTRFDSSKDIGNELIPVDIDADGVFEFSQDVMMFDYFFASHADSPFPPVVFAYDKKKGRYDFANKKFSDFVMNELKENLDWLAKQNVSETESESSKKMNKRYVVRKTFLNQVYAGKEKEGWKYFDENYVFEDKEEYRTEIKERFSEDITYKSIYRR